MNWRARLRRVLTELEAEAGDPKTIAALRLKLRLPKGAGRLRVTHCPQGHEYTPRNTKYNSQGNRYCIECKRVKSREWYRAHRMKGKPKKEFVVKLSEVMTSMATKVLENHSMIRGAVATSTILTAAGSDFSIIGQIVVAPEDVTLELHQLMETTVKEFLAKRCGTPIEFTEDADFVVKKAN